MRSPPAKLLFSSPRPVLDHVPELDHVTVTDVTTALPCDSLISPLAEPLLPPKLFQLPCGTTPAVSDGDKTLPTPSGGSLAPKLSPILTGTTALGRLE